MDSDFRVDINEVIKNLESADVVSFFFPLLRKTLLLDMRSDSVDGPLVRVVPMVDNIEERFRSLRRMRPRFARPESITVIPWPKYVGGLVRSGLWDRIVRRFADQGHADAVRACQEALDELFELERQELANAISGEKYQSLWERTKKS